MILLFDASPAMAPYIRQVNATAQRTLSRLDPHDRVAIVLIGEKLTMTRSLALNRDMVVAAIGKIQLRSGPKDLNGAIALTAHYLRDHARPDAAPAILVKTNDSPGEADVRPFIQASGGEIRFMDPKNVPLSELLQGLRVRYRIDYRAPGGYVVP